MVQTKQKLQNYKIEVSGKTHPISNRKVSFKQIIDLVNPEPINPGADERQIYVIYSNVASSPKNGILNSSDQPVTASKSDPTKFNVIINDIFVRT